MSWAGEDIVTIFEKFSRLCRIGGWLRGFEEEGGVLYSSGAFEIESGWLSESGVRGKIFVGEESEWHFDVN